MNVRSGVDAPHATLGDFLRFRNGKTSPSRSESGGVFVFGSNGAIGKTSTANFEEPTIVIGRVGSYCGSLHYSAGPSWVTDNAIACQPKQDDDPRYWYYALQALGLNGRSSGSGQPLLNQTILNQIEFLPPSIPERRAIAQVLGALDEKIAANMQLSEIADDYLSARFQLELASGVDFAPLETIAEVNAQVVKPIAGQFLRYIDIASVGVGAHSFPELTPWEDAPSRARRRVRPGDTLWSTVRPNRRSHSLNLSEDSKLVASTGLAVLSPRGVGFAYLYEVTRLHGFTTHLENVAEGSAYPAVRAEQFKAAPVPLLPPQKRVAFEDLATPIRQNLHSLDEENRTLARLRDTLLPELMSGRLRVKDAEKQIEEVG